MIQIFRKNQRGLMLIVAVVTIIAFVFLYNTTQLDELASIRNPTIYGKALTPEAIDRQVKNYQLTMALGQLDLLEKLGGTAEDQAVAISEFVWNLLVLQHNSRELGIQPTDDQVADRIKTLPIFQTGDQFDPVKYSTFVGEQLTPRGFTERQLEEVIRDSLRMEAVAAIVESPVAMGKAELETTARIFQPVTGVYAKFKTNPDDPQAAPTAEEIAQFHQQNQAALVAEESRTVRCAILELPAEPKLEGKEKIDALQKLANTASAITEKIAGGAADFEKAAKDAGAKIEKLAAFHRTGEPAKPDAKQALEPETMRAIAPAAFLLTGPGQTSDVLQSGDAFYIVELVETTPSRPLTLDEAKPRIEENLRAQKASQIFAAAATAAYNTLSAAIASGKSLEEAAAAQNLETGKLENLVPAGESTSPQDQSLAAATLLLKDGELSKLEQAPWGAFAIQLQSRGPVDEKLFTEREDQISESILRNKRDLLFAEWLRVGREAARITMPGSNQG
jgi:parvulin-like peptidyl-prolyl isomerase